MSAIVLVGRSGNCIKRTGKLPSELSVQIIYRTELSIYAQTYLRARTNAQISVQLYI